MKSTLKIEINTLVEKIITFNQLNDIDTSHRLAKELYEKLTVLQFFKTQPESVLQSETPMGKKTPAAESLISALDEDLFVTNEPVASNLLEPATEKMIDIVAQMEPETQQVDALIQDIVATPTFVKNDIEDVTPATEDILTTETISKSLNDRLKKGITIGLNDRIAFVKHLFNDSTEDFNRVISQLNTLGSELEALEFLNTMVKPEYNNWENKEVYEQRFLTFIEGKY